MDKVLSGLEILSKVFDQQSAFMVSKMIQQVTLFPFLVRFDETETYIQIELGAFNKTLNSSQFVRSLNRDGPQCCCTWTS